MIDAPSGSDRTGPADTVLAWGREPDISARSVLVTILGDTVAPLGCPVWLGDLIALAEPFGFSHRLVRTSLFRLAAEGWVTSERVGRRSRYSLTPYGRREIGSAEQRIYHQTTRRWDGWWTLVFLPDGEAAATDRGEKVAGGPGRLLRWRGFAPIGDGVLARPGDHTVETRQLLDHEEITPVPLVATARFDERAPEAAGSFRHDSGLAAAEEAYARFEQRYTPFDGIAADAVDPHVAFALRTMIVHDLRRARLRDPDLPTALLPDDWVGHRATDLAARIYRALTDDAWAWITEVTGLDVDPSTPPVSTRFGKETTP